MKHAEEKKIDINALNECGDSAIVVAKKHPKIVKILMKHCKYDKKSLMELGAECLASIMLLSDDEESEKSVESEESFESFESFESEEPVESE